MTSAYETCSAIEAKARAIVVPWLKKNRSDDGNVVEVNGGNCSQFIQEHCGDFICRHKGQMRVFELKSEKLNPRDNLFLEVWSNGSRRTPGWMMKMRADVLLYFFMDSRDLYEIDAPMLIDWAFAQKNIWKYPMPAQQKYDQRNDTRGYLVPIPDLFSANASNRVLIRMHSLNAVSVELPDDIFPNE